MAIITFDTEEGVVKQDGHFMHPQCLVDDLYALIKAQREKITQLEAAKANVSPELSRLVAENERMREALLSLIPKPDENPKLPPFKVNYMDQQGVLNWGWKKDLKIWEQEQTARKGLGLPYLIEVDRRQ